MRDTSEEFEDDKSHSYFVKTSQLKKQMQLNLQKISIEKKKMEEIQDELKKKKFLIEFLKENKEDYKWNKCFFFFNKIK